MHVQHTKDTDMYKAFNNAQHSVIKALQKHNPVEFYNTIRHLLIIGCSKHLIVQK